MKKVDEATGMTIEVPSNTAIRSKFPYPGFWAAVYPNLTNAITTHALPSQGRAEIDRALSMLIKMMNGEQAVILTERVYYIGELMELNNTLPVEGRAGMTLGYVRASKDGGRMEVAAKIFEAPIRAILAQSSGKTMAENSMSTLLNEQSSYKKQLERLTVQLRDLEQGANSREFLNQMSKSIEESENRVLAIQKEIDIRQNQIEVLMKQRVQFDKTKKQHDTDGAEVNRLRLMISNSNNNNTRAAATAALAPVLDRYNSAGQWLKRTAFSVSDSVLKDLETLQSQRTKELNQLQSEIVQQINEFNRLTTHYHQSVTQGQKVWAEMQATINHLQGLESNISNASSAMNNFTEIETNKLARIWVSHIASCRVELEQLLFKAKANEMGAIQGSPKAILAEPLVDPGQLKDHEDFTEAVYMIMDALPDEEVELLEEIGRLGLAMSYVPGGARVLALSELRKSKRIVAYRNLIEEILSQGQKLDTDSKFSTFDIGLPGLGPFIFENSDDLAEVRELLRHLADSRLNYKYGGGN